MSVILGRDRNRKQRTFRHYYGHTDPQIQDLLSGDPGDEFPELEPEDLMIDPVASSSAPEITYAVAIIIAALPRWSRTLRDA